MSIDWASEDWKPTLSKVGYSLNYIQLLTESLIRSCVDHAFAFPSSLKILWRYYCRFIYVDYPCVWVIQLEHCFSIQASQNFILLKIARIWDSANLSGSHFEALLKDFDNLFDGYFQAVLLINSLFDLLCRPDRFARCYQTSTWRLPCSTCSSWILST